MNVGFKLFHPFLMFDPEALLFIYDQKRQAFETYALG
ncbi:MAG: Uncharacterised protein [Hyphomonas sp. TMED17]|nr:MAG: Uncharacterised protein [Hyphomonas sp. TMED17]